jgi:two-component system, response regulator PdtaR
VLRVLIAEDEPALAYALRRQLELSGHQVVGIAGNGSEAAELCQATHPDVVVMDVGMPVMDGIQATRRIMQEGLTCVLVLTAFEGHEVTAEAEAAGAMGCLAKPAGGPEVLRAMEGARARFAEFGLLHAEAKDLEAAVAARLVVERAKRLLVRQLHVEAAAAFSSLGEAAAEAGLSLRAMAEEIVSRDRP